MTTIANPIYDIVFKYLLEDDRIAQGFPPMLLRTKVLSVFDQSHNDGKNKHTLDIDESAYDGDREMQLIINRLTAAAADARMRHDMNVEDEYFSVIEKRDTTIMLKDKRIAEQNTQIAEQNSMLRNSVKAFRAAGFSDEQIATTLNTTLQTVRDPSEA